MLGKVYIVQERLAFVPDIGFGFFEGPSGGLMKNRLSFEVRCVSS